MKILNFGSLNIDYVYAVPHFVAAGETLSSDSRGVFCGGKGLNQSIALAKAGAEVYHAGCIGAEGGFLVDALRGAGVDTRYVKTVSEPCGHAIIQVNIEGNNCIVLYGGANEAITTDYADEVLKDFSAGDWIILQNEINVTPYVAHAAKAKGMTVVLNPSPYNARIEQISLDDVDYVLVNETEGKMMSGGMTSPDDILSGIAARHPGIKTVLTLGGDGSVYCGDGVRVRQGIVPVKVVDTTAAGDTFTGYFIAEMSNGTDAATSLKVAAAAAAIAVSRPGASPSVPTREETDALVRTL